MRFGNGIMRPATVLKVVDNRGTIKVEAPGLFSITDDPEKLPPVYPLFLQHKNEFSSPEVSEEVWVINLTDNDQQLYWLRKDSLDDNKRILTNEEGTIDILLNRDVNGVWGTLYFSDGSGWVISRDKSKININAEGDIILQHPNPNRTIAVNSDNISLGAENGKSSHTATFADQLIPILDDITRQFEVLKKAMQKSPYTTPAAKCIDTSVWKDKINKIESKNVTLE